MRCAYCNSKIGHVQAVDGSFCTLECAELYKIEHSEEYEIGKKLYEESKQS